MPAREKFANDVRWSALDVRAAAFDRLGACVALLDSKGVIVDTNQAWRLFAHLNNGTPLSTGIGVNYLEVCDRAAAAGVAVSGKVASGLRQILSGERNQIDAEYPCPSPTEDRWFMLQASALIAEIIPPLAVGAVATAVSLVLLPVRRTAGIIVIVLTTVLMLIGAVPFAVDRLHGVPGADRRLVG